MILLVKLFLAHIIGDFILQPQSWVADKNLKKVLSGRLYLHGIIHGVLAALFVFETAFLSLAVFLTIVHIFIDLLKVVFQNSRTSRKWFIYDQLLHFASIAMIAFLYDETLWFQPDERTWIVVASVVFLTLPSSIIIRNLISVWTPKQPESAEPDLQNAGKYIGILERLFVFTFIITGHFEGVGFLLAAKSIFRFGDLTRARDRRLTEYVMIGTLLSFGISIATAFLAAHLLILG